MKRQPWIEGENIVLSPAHPEPDICDDVVADNPYKVGEITLPLHVQCLCFKESVLMSDTAFVDRMRGWLGGSQTWPEMDSYTTGLGVGSVAIINPDLLDSLAGPMLRWLDGPQDEIETVMSGVPVPAGVVV
jgi:hypothetical protein